mgnify:CR=1 FL=1
MCIRDRLLHTATKANPRRAGELVDAIGKALGEQTVTVPGTCLLYTSDAADERSSVDLGGRRIIKKKNKTTTSGMWPIAETIQSEQLERGSRGIV